MKSLSTKTIQKMYEKARITEKESDILHKYLLCFSNLYGCIQIKDLWNVFKQYKEKISKEKFYDYININQREDNEYLILNLNEAYSGEISAETKDKLLVNKYIVKRFDLKFWYLHRLEEVKDYSHGPYIPSKDELFKFDHDIFYESIIGKKMLDFVLNLKASGFEYDRFDDTKKELMDLNGNSIKGKFIKDIVCYSDWERFEIKRCKRENEKEYLIKENNITCAEKILNNIKHYVLIENPSDFSNSIKQVLDYMNCDFGVDITTEGVKEFVDIFIELTNKSNRWSMFGWSSEKLFRITPCLEGPIELQLGPNIQKMIENGEYNLEELEKFIKDNKLNAIITKQKS